MTVGLQIRGGTKVYPGTRALQGVDFDLHLGAVNVLVGENGAGKSTMMKVIAGVEHLTEGQILIDGHPVRLDGPDAARRHGIGIVFQELNLFPNLTVAENIFMGRECTRAGIDIDRGEQRARTRALMARLEQDIHPDTLLGDLRVGQQQIVEIAKSLARDARILILDEPTSALSATEVEILFRVIGDLRRQGVGIVYISHRLEELLRIGDHITVLRDGRITGARSMEGVDLDWIVRAMIGGASKDYAKATDHPFGPEVFRAEDVCLTRPGGMAVDHVSLTVREGEILGVYGLMGAGRSEFLECVIGRHRHATGRLFIQGRPLTARSIAGRIAQGIALIPEDRKNDGLVQILSIRENMTLSSLGQVTTAGVHMNLGAERRRVGAFIKRLVVKIASMDNPVSSLSGGNQQKVVIGKALMTRPKVLLMDEPSRGIDIGAKAEVFRTMRELAAQGLGIVFVTSDLEELMALSDRIVVMSNGRVTGRFDRRDATETALVAASAKGHSIREPAA
ncbi:sugar ABC transporter ATP-binding protein [Paracoccus liaowanqingii]|uniref:Sugar ABC transporter ATP-binding protein n=1 Tax=Paracoccus liaowanqingii TaxID=2560053 RepID=A0A4Z1CQK5_9RHOB|nr:sugar ABC transporter ATP-binding protein [Paracoccus liaowanqingii]TGN67291.1 sugar ABC transporter ATP-binding protein [Paracoccus liaowanqingii]